MCVNVFFFLETKNVIKSNIHIQSLGVSLKSGQFYVELKTKMATKTGFSFSALEPLGN